MFNLFKKKVIIIIKKDSHNHIKKKTKWSPSSRDPPDIIKARFLQGNLSIYLTHHRLNKIYAQLNCHFNK